MSLTKITAIIFILIAGLTGSYLIIDSSKNNFVSDLVSQVETVKDFNSEDFDKDVVLAQSGKEAFKLNEENVSSDNLTGKFSAAIFEQIDRAELSSQGDATKFLSELKSKNLVNDVFENAQADFKLISDIEKGGIKIFQDNSKEIKIQYLKTIEEITKKNFGDFKKNYMEVILDSFQKLDSSSAGRLANIYKNLAGDYLRLSVPSDFADIHERTIIYFKNAEIVYKAMSEYQNDPIKGYLALEMIDKLTAEIEQIQIALEEKIKNI